MVKKIGTFHPSPCSIEISRITTPSLLHTTTLTVILSSDLDFVPFSVHAVQRIESVPLNTNHAVTDELDQKCWKKICLIRRPFVFIRRAFTCDSTFTFQTVGHNFQTIPSPSTCIVNFRCGCGLGYINYLHRYTIRTVFDHRHHAA